MGLSDQSLEETLNKLKILFLITGLKLRGIKPNKILYIFNSAWLNTDVIGCICWLSNGIINGMSFKQISFVAPCLTFSILGDIKAIYFSMHDKDVYQLIDDLIKLGKKPSDSSNIDEIKETEISFLNRVIKVFIILTGLMIFIFNVGPLLLTASTYYRTGELKLFLPFLDIYPFDGLDLKYWPYAYIHQVWSVCIVLCDACCVDCILFACCTYIRIQFRLLQLDVKDLFHVKAISRGKFHAGAQFELKFQEIINRHQEIIRLSKSLENIFSIIILLNFMTSSIVICFTGFNIMIIEDITLVVTFVIFLVMSLSQVWSLCYFGDLLMTSSAGVSDAVFASKWYAANDTSITINLRIIQKRAQKPCKLTAFGFADVNLRAFMQILSKAWSYFALLQTIYTP